MRLFEWLKSPRPAEPEVCSSALADLLKPGKCMVLEPGLSIVDVPEYPEAQRIAESLRDFPEDWAWKQKGYTLAHVPSGFSMWVANGESYLGECTEGKDIKFSPEEQTIIWQAYQPWINNFKVGFTGRLPKVKITARRGTFWCVAEDHPWAGVGSSPADAYRAWSRAVSIQARKDTNPKEYLQVWSAAL